MYQEMCKKRVAHRFSYLEKVVLNMTSEAVPDFVNVSPKIHQ